ncbi:uncharacterized protein [Arachis hypogaea]|uniref:uncharacterized protein n=1 Tax=Arachis hypogaea TaxID=3818 RepID=UPI003B228812
MPSASGVAALIVGDVEQLSKDRDIIIESQSKKLQRIDVFHPSYLALPYSLLFLYGEDGFCLDITTLDSISARLTKKNKTITLRQFFSFRLQRRTGESPSILRLKRLSQQFLIDAYTMVESERLKFFRCKQPQLRVDKYKYLHESLINRDVDAARLGKRIILPSTFTGGPRYMMNNYVCTVEFQKRGLSHAHILLFMSNEFKPQTSYDIDKHITAEILDENERPNLHGAIQNYMGNDRVTATLYNAGDPPEATQVVDEIRNCYYCRYISTCEAVWRLFGYEIQEKEPFVIRLPFHLEDEQPVVYGETSNVNDIVKRAISHKFIFLGWMTANMSYPYARSLTYAEFPTKFVWKDDSLKWFSRKKDFAIGRLTHVPTELTMLDDEIKQLCLMDIYKILHFYGKIFKDYPHMPLTTEVDSSLLTERLCIVMKGGFFFVDGLGGIGKIFLWNLMSAEIRSRGDIVLNIASSGIASLLFPNGRTTHSKFKTPPNITEDSVCNIKPDSPQAILLLKAKLIIWDEAPMVSRYCYEALDKCLGDIMRCSPIYSKDLPFGGKVVVLGGDFRQIFLSFYEDRDKISFIQP